MKVIPVICHRRSRRANVHRSPPGDSSVPIGVICDTSGDHAYVAHANADVITEINLATGEIIRLLRAGREPDGMGYSPLTAGDL